MGLLRAASDPVLLVSLAVAFVVAITIHEFLHAWVADRLGDPTPRRENRVTLNPLRHLDPMGTILLALVGFGWGRPVMVNPLNFSVGPRTGMALVAVAGPLSNVVLALALAPVARTFVETTGADPMAETLGLILILTVQINVLLAIFNLIPIPPLDGFSVLVGVVPREIAFQLDRLRTIGPFLLLGLLIAGPFLGLNVIGFLVGGPISFVNDVLLGT